MAQTPTQALATLKLGADVAAWVTAQRNSEPQPSFQTIANTLRDRTGVDVTDQTVRLWCASYAEAAAS